MMPQDTQVHDGIQKGKIRPQSLLHQRGMGGLLTVRRTDYQPYLR